MVETGPATIRRLCCGTRTPADQELIEAALDAIDDPVALVGERPVAVEALWKTALRSASCACDGAVVVHPSWWPPARVRTVSAAAATVADEVRARPRSWLLARASRAAMEDTVVVEVAERLVAICGPAPATVTAVPRTAPPRSVADGVARAVASLAPAAVLIDLPEPIAGPAELGPLIADALRGQTRAEMVHINDIPLARLACSASDGDDAPAGPDRSAAAPLAITAAPDRARTMPGTFLVEGRVALSVPNDWPTQRLVGGPGSARVQVTSPTDPEVVLHITQSPVVGETLGDTARRLKQAIDAAPAGVFVDFDPTATSVGRPAVTYREIRPAHQVRWTVLLEGPVRISIGCQSRPGAEQAVREACELAVRSAHAIG
ncbi:hypothetical protein MLM_3551 [Mycobacterium lepraemurium]|nr:hypothetical protein MLM_3551 [Mycobacterium lepraemurium]